MDTELVLPETLAEAHAVIRELWAAVQEVRTAHAALVAAHAALVAAHAALVAAHAALVAAHAALVTENAALRERMARLEARLGQTSQNSSRPPSSDPPWTPPPPAKRPPSGRKPGGQPGHVAHQREVLPPEQVDRIVVSWPEQCQHCGKALPPDDGLIAAAPVRHQVSELPPVRVEVTEYQLQRLRCPECGEETRAALPAGVPTGAFGPRLQAAVAGLSGRYRLSRRAVVGILADLVGARVALGSVDALCQNTSAALAQPVAALEHAVRAAPVANADETSWLQANKLCWLWVVVTRWLTVFSIAPSRRAEVIKGMLGEDFAGIVTSDRYQGYFWLGVLRRQLCWAHLRRDFQGLVDRGGAAEEVGQPALALVARIFTAWHAAREDPVADERLPETMQPIQEAFRTLLEVGQQSPSSKAAGLCRALLALWPALWTFVTVPGVQPTNNAAERAVRPAVLWRKQSLGTKTEAGNQFVARILSVAATCLQQQRPFLDYLTAVCSAHQLGQPIPSLLPGPP